LAELSLELEAGQVLGLLGPNGAGMRMRRLSGGMIQRVCLAAALVATPKVLLLDGPTAGLDPSRRSSFRSMIGGLADTAVVLSTHLTEDVATLATETMVLDRGRILFRGHPRDLEQLGEIGDTRVGAASPLEQGYQSLFANAAEVGEPV
jgi:ABC-2 type transport system ATP-binding protein